MEAKGASAFRHSRDVNGKRRFQEMMKKIYRVWRSKNVEASLSDSSTAGCGEIANFEDVRVPVREKVAVESEEEALRKAREGVDEGEVLINESGESSYGDFCVA